jgi:hypothetical protein
VKLWLAGRRDSESAVGSCAGVIPRIALSKTTTAMSCVSLCAWL